MSLYALTGYEGTSCSAVKSGKHERRGMYYLKTKIKYIFGLAIFSSTLILNISFARAAYSANTLVSMTNSARSENGLGTLSTNAALTSAAYAKAQDILAQDYFAHNSPDGRTPWDFINASGYTYAYAGENLGIGYSDASELFTAWMNSSTHRENILNANYREIGIAVITGEYQGVETIVVVQEFGTSQVSSEEQVASENSTPVPTESSVAENANPASTATPVATQNSENVNLELNKEQSSFSPQSIYFGEEVEFKVTLSGEAKSLEVQVFDQKFNLLESGSVTGNEQKTYTLKQKIENKGSSEIKIIATDQKGEAKSLVLGSLEVKETIITKAENSKSAGFIAGFKESIQNNWVIYLSVLMIILLIVTLFVFSRKANYQKLLASWKF